MEIIHAILLGIIEGLTEFLPISSTGHLIVAEDLLNYKDTSKIFTVVIQMGAIAAVIWYYRRDLWQLVKGLIKNETNARRFWLVWILATIPAGLAGLIFDAQFDTYATLTTVAVALIVGGVIIWLIENFHRSPPDRSQAAHLEKITIKQSVAIGLYQTLALIPGVSRSGATILGGMLSGLDRVTATAFSFYLSIPILLLAGIYKLVSGDVSSVTGGSSALVIGVLAAFFTALFVISWLLKYVSAHDFKPFAYYRIAVGVILLMLIGIGTVG